MITAAQATAQMVVDINSILERIESCIKSTIAKKSNSTTIDLSSLKMGDSEGAVLKRLRNFGYQADVSYDQRDGNFMTITWPRPDEKDEEDHE